MHPSTGVEAKPGDVVVVHGHTTGDPGRTGVILEVLGGGGTSPHYRVRWDEEHETLYWPGSDASIRPGVGRRPPATHH